MEVAGAVTMMVAGAVTMAVAMAVAVMMAVAGADGSRLPQADGRRLPHQADGRRLPHPSRRLPRQAIALRQGRRAPITEVGGGMRANPPAPAGRASTMLVASRWCASMHSVWHSLLLGGMCSVNGLPEHICMAS